MDFGLQHADVAGQLSAWCSEVEDSHWKGPFDIKSRFPSASFLADNRVVFNVKGNKYRIDSKISYENQLVLVKRIGTHAEYSKWAF